MNPVKKDLKISHGVKVSFNLVNLVVFVFLCVTQGCSTPSPAPVEVLSSQNFETIVIGGTNDIHGGIVPLQLKTREPEGQISISYEAAGLSTLASYIRILQKEYGPKFLWLDAGDHFQGTIESNSAKGAPMTQFFNAMRLHAAGIGNHEFDYGAEPQSKYGPEDHLGALKARMEEAQYPYLLANILDRNSNRYPDFPNYKPSTIFQVGGLKVGVLAVTTTEAARTTLPTNIKTLKFTPLLESTIRESEQLKKQGAEVIVLIAHAWIRCGSGKMPEHTFIRKQEDPQGECATQMDLVELMNQLPEGTVDAVVSGHSHQVIHHWIRGVPIIQGGASARYINLIYLTYDYKNQKLRKDLTRIEGPIPICPKVFQNQGDCNGDRPAPKNGRGPLVKPEFHRVTIEPDSEIETLMAPTIVNSAKIKAEVIARAERMLDQDRFRECAVGNLVADAIRDRAKADVGLVNSGGIRSGLEAGEITYGDVFRVLPFDNYVATLRVTGHELKTIIRVAESGSRGFPAVSGIKLKLIDLKYDAPSNDLDGDRKIEPWEINRLKEIRLVRRDSDGEIEEVPINDQKFYTLATLDFLVLGGDDLSWALSKIPHQRISYDSRLLRDVVTDYLRAGKVWNQAQSPLLDPKNPRLKFVNPKEKEKKIKKLKKIKRKVKKSVK